MAKICIIGAGYVGLSLAILLAQKNSVRVLEIDTEKIQKINSRVSPILDREISHFLSHKTLDLIASANIYDSLLNAEIVIIATPTNFDTANNTFDVSSVLVSIKNVLEVSPNAEIFIKSTIPIGFTESVSKELNIQNLHFSPEFLREGKALYDNLHPSRIIVGTKNNAAGMTFANLLKEASDENQTPILITAPTEAECIKLFSNSYLALRVAFFNELDTFAAKQNLNTKSIIEGVCLDPRIGNFYNNPSFGYGGYCLPKDTKQLLAHYENIPSCLIQAIVEANQIRKDFIVDDILKYRPKTIGIYRLIMKSDSDNFRESAIQGVMRRLKERERANLIIFEPLLNAKSFLGIPVESDLQVFKDQCDIILTNRFSLDLQDVRHKVYSRDVFHNT